MERLVKAPLLSAPFICAAICMASAVFVAPSDDFIHPKKLPVTPLSVHSESSDSGEGEVRTAAGSPFENNLKTDSGLNSEQRPMPEMDDKTREWLTEKIIAAIRADILALTKSSSSEESSEEASSESESKASSKVEPESDVLKSTLFSLTQGNSSEVDIESEVSVYHPVNVISIEPASTNINFYAKNLPYGTALQIDDPRAYPSGPDTNDAEGDSEEEDEEYKSGPLHEAWSSRGSAHHRTFSITLNVGDLLFIFLLLLFACYALTRVYQLCVTPSKDARAARNLECPTAIVSPPAYTLPHPAAVPPKQTSTNTEGVTVPANTTTAEAPQPKAVL